MITTKENQIKQVIDALFEDSKYDHIKMMKGAAKSLFRPLQPSDFKDAYLSISRVKGEDLVKLIEKSQSKQIIEFGTSFGISSLYLAKGALQTGGSIITTELIESKAQIANENFTKAGVDHLIEVRVGDAMNTLSGHREPIDFLLLDGWKNLYLPLFNMLAPNFHQDTLIYVDNADMGECLAFLRVVSKSRKYVIESLHDGKVALITLR